MKIKIFAATSLIFSFLFFSCSKDETIDPSNTITSQEHNITGYNELNVQDAFNVEVHFSNEIESIIVEANDNLHPYIILEKNLMELSIRLDDNIDLSEKQATLNVYISTDHMFSYRASGATTIQLLDPLGADKLIINLSGASSLSGNLTGTEVNAIITGASTLNLTGSANKFNLDATGASNMYDFDFVANWLHTNLEGACTASITVNNKLDVWANGASTVYYKGDGVINTQELSGGSQIIKVN